MLNYAKVLAFAILDNKEAIWLTCWEDSSKHSVLTQASNSKNGVIWKRVRGGQEEENIPQYGWSISPLTKLHTS